MVRGTFLDLIAPTKSGNVTVNGVPVTLTILPKSEPYGPFAQSFETTLTMSEYDLLIKVEGRNALSNLGMDKIVTTANFNESTGAFESRAFWELESTPIGIDSHLFRLEIRDPLAQGNALTVILYSDAEPPKMIPLFRFGSLFLSNTLCLIPEIADLTGVPPEVVQTRIKARLGTKIRVTFMASDGSTCEDRGLVIGATLVNASDQAPLDVIRAGLARDVIHNTSDNDVLVLVGAPGDLPGLPSEGGVPYLTGTLVPSTYRDQAASLGTATTKALRVGQNAIEPEFNLFRTETGKAILPLASKAEMWTTVTPRTLVEVESGGFLRLDVQTGTAGVGPFQAVEHVRGEIVVGVLVDGLGAGFPRDAFPEPEPENLETLMAAGSLPNFQMLIADANGIRIRYDGHTTFPSITYSAWSSWVTGTDPKDHGVTGSNFYRRGDPASDPFWCGANLDSNCDLGLYPLGAGMQPPIDMVTFLSPLDGTFDFDIVNVWSEIGTLNSAIRPRTQEASSISTIYERLDATGLLSAAVYHFPFRGASTGSFPTAWQGHEQHEDTSGRRLDLGTSKELDSLMGLMAPHVRPPQLLTVYYAGFDTHIHNDSSYPSGGFATSHLTYTDKHLGRLIRILDQWNLLEDAIFTFNGDHGLSRVADDDIHSLVLETAGDQEIEQIMIAAGFDPLDFASETAHDAVLAMNGGMVHIYVKNRAPAVDSWSALPRYMEDVRVMAERFYDNNTGILHDDPEGSYIGAFDLILLRNPTGGFNGPYEILVKQGGNFSTITLSQAVAKGMVDPTYINFVTNIQRLQDIRSGDVILLTEGICRNDATGYYFGAPLPGWHGSLCASDMTIPIVFSFPHGAAGALSRFLSIVDINLPRPPGEARITNIEPTIYDLLTLEAP